MGALQGRAERLKRGLFPFAGRYVLLGLPLAFVVILFVVPLTLTFVWSFYEPTGFGMRPSFTLASFQDFFTGVRLFVLRQSLLMAAWATLVSLLLAFPIAYWLSMRVRGELGQALLFLFTVPFIVNHIIRTVSWTYLLDRTGPVNVALIKLGLIHHPLDWLLYSDFAVLLGLVTSYMPFMIFPLYLALSGIDRRVIEASWLLGAGPRTTFLRVTFPLSLPGVFAAVIFGFVGSFGEDAVPIILGGAGYQLMGNAITSVLDVLNYPLAAAISSVVVVVMIAFLAAWLAIFDIRSFLGKIVRWRM
jgi:ABC-type spermidine/putrescine transport system permease subunit I